MGLLGFKSKSKKQEQDGEFEPSSNGNSRGGELRKRSLKNRDFKDLNPSDQKKRKEPKKPWGRRERSFVFVVFLFTAGFSGYLALSARDWKLPGLPRIAVGEISLPQILGEETIVIEGSKEDVKKAEKAKSEFRSETKILSGVYGLYVIRLGNGLGYGINESDVFQAASLIKLPVMAALYREAENGDLSLSGKYKLKQEDKVEGAGSLYSKAVGYEITYRDLIRLMGKQSDNTAFRIVRNILGEAKINEMIQRIGMKNTSLEKNETTPEDIGIFFEELWNGNVVNNRNKEELLSFLTDTAYEDWLPEGLPDGVKIAHKVGIDVHVVNDAGIVYADRPYLIVILTKGVVEKEAKEVLPKLSKIIYDVESGN